MTGSAVSKAVGRHDPAEWKLAQSAAQLETVGIDPHGPTPTYRIWAGQRGRFIITLREGRPE